MNKKCDTKIVCIRLFSSLVVVETFVVLMMTVLVMTPIKTMITLSIENVSDCCDDNDDDFGDSNNYDDDANDDKKCDDDDDDNELVQ